MNVLLNTTLKTPKKNWALLTHDPPRAEPPPTAICVITNHPARYRDPKTGLPFYNAFAYREIQRLRRGDYKWSSLLGAWTGSAAYAARGVPEGFLHPDKVPQKTKQDKDKDKDKDKEAGGDDKDKKEAEDSQQQQQQSDDKMQGSNVNTADKDSAAAASGDAQVKKEDGQPPPPQQQQQQPTQPAGSNAATAQTV
jgi:vacuolar protein sorting-associated protein 72